MLILSTYTSQRFSKFLFTTIIASEFILMAWITSQQVTGFHLGDYNHYVCRTGSEIGSGHSPGNKGTFRILTLTSKEAREFADALCASPAVARLFAAVDIEWRKREFLTANHIVNESYDYLWSREHLMTGLVPDYSNYYIPLHNTPDYSIYWFSRHPGMELTNHYLQGKVVGFLQDSHSQTFFLQPFRSLKDAGITLAANQKRFYEDIHALYAAFQVGDIDVVSGTDYFPKELSTQVASKQIMTTGVSSGFWYLRKRWLGSGIECELTKTAHHSPYLNENPANIQATSRCGLDS